MTSVVERLSVELGVDRGNLEASLKKAGGATDRFAKLTDQALGGVVLGAFATVGNKLIEFGGNAVRVFANTRFEIDELAKTSSKLEIPTERLAGLELAAEKSGVKVQALRVGIQRATRRISEAAQGTSVASTELEKLAAVSGKTSSAVGGATDGTSKALAELGLSARELVNLSPDESLLRIADAFEGIDNQSDRVRLAFKLFDSEGVALVNTLEGGSEAIRSAFEEAEKLGLALSSYDTGRVERANEAILAIQRSSTGIARQFTAAFAPVVEAIATVFVDSQGDIRDWRDFFESAVSGAVEALGVFLKAWDGVKAAILAAATIGVEAFEAVVFSVEFVARAIDKFAQKLGVDLLDGVPESIGAFRQEVEALATTLDEKTGDAFSNIGVTSQEVTAAIEQARRVRREATADPGGDTGDTGAENERTQALLQAERERAQAQLAAFERSLATRQEVIELDYQKQLEQLAAFREAELVSETERTDLLAAITQQRADRITALEEQAAAEQKRITDKKKADELKAAEEIKRAREKSALATANTLGNIGQTILNIGGRQNKAAVAASKALGITQIGIQTAVGAARAIGELGPIAGPAAAASIISGGIASIASVAATQLGGSPLGGAGAPAGASGAVGAIGSGDLCGAVREVSQCGGRAEDEARLGSADSRPIQVVQFGDADVEALMREIKRKVDDEDLLLFEGTSRQAQEASL